MHNSFACPIFMLFSDNLLKIKHIDYEPGRVHDLEVLPTN
jgi:hypothetical protein